MSMLSGFCWTVVFCWSNKDIQFWFSNKLKSNEHTPTCQLVLTKQVSPEFSVQLVNFGSFFISLFMTQLSFCNHLIICLEKVTWTPLLLPNDKCGWPLKFLWNMSAKWFTRKLRNFSEFQLVSHFNMMFNQAFRNRIRNFHLFLEDTIRNSVFLYLFENR